MPPIEHWGWDEAGFDDPQCLEDSHERGVAQAAHGAGLDPTDRGLIEAREVPQGSLAQPGRDPSLPKPEAEPPTRPAGVNRFFETHAASKPAALTHQLPRPYRLMRNKASRMRWDVRTLSLPSAVFLRQASPAGASRCR